MNENAIHGAPKNDWEWRIALSNHYAWLQTCAWRTHERKCNSWGSEKGLRMENCTKQSLRIAPSSWVEDARTKTQFMVLRKRVEDGESHYAIITHGSKFVGRGRMNENAIHGSPKKNWEWRIALSNHYAWLQTRGWRTHERKRNSWGSEKGLRMEKCTKQSLRIAPNSLVEDTWTKTQFMGLQKRIENGELQ